MQVDLKELALKAIQDGIREGVKDKLRGYNSPIEKFADAILQENAVALKALFTEAINAAVSDPSFRQEVAAALRQTLAKQLVQKFGGELEKQVNVLKSDPATRARIILAIEEIVKQRPIAA